MKKLLLVVVFLFGVILKQNFIFAENKFPASENLLKKADADSLIYQKWILIKLNGKDNIKEEAWDDIPYLEFHLKDNKLSGFTGCNYVYGNVSVTESEITFSNVSTTKRGCRNTQYILTEMEFINLIFYQKPLKYKVEYNLLTILKDGKEVLVLEANKPKSQNIDKDKNKFNSVIIGTQEWMTENLNVECYRNGDSIPWVQDAEEWEKLTTGAWCYYKNDSGNNKIHGKLYNWYAVTDSRGLAPEGWHIPDWDEWNLLITYLGGEKIAGEKLKAVSDLWEKNPYAEGTNESGFTAIPSGCRVYDGWFYLVGIKSCFWTSSYPVENRAISVELIFQSKSVTYYYEDKRGGLSVRCLKD